MKYSKKENIGDDVSQEEKELDTIELQSILKSEMDDAQDFADQLGSERAENTEYYLGDAPGDAGELQSEYVSTDVREAVLHMLPGIMRTFFGTKKVVEYLPKNANDIALSEQQTDYINYLVTQKNNGFQVFYNTFKDALVRKAGFIKAYFDQSLEVTYHAGAAFWFAFVKMLLILLTGFFCIFQTRKISRLSGQSVKILQRF